MTQQTNGTPDLKYSEEAFRDMYEALKVMNAGNSLSPGNPNRVWERATPPTVAILKAFKALAKAEGKGGS